MSLKNASVLVIDDDPDVLIAVRLLLKTEVKKVVTEKNPENLPSLLRETNFDLVLLDMNFKSSINTGNEGLYWLKRIKELNSSVAVIMITAYGDIDLAVRSLKEGATDFILKPWHNEKLLTNIEEIIQKNKHTSNGTAKPDASGSIIGSELLGESEAMQNIFFKVEKIAPTDANILILGENGTGKDLINGLDPEVVVIGGEITKAWGLIEPIIVKETQRSLLAPRSHGVPIRPSAFEVRPSLKGALTLIQNNLLSVPHMG